MRFVLGVEQPFRFAPITRCKRALLLRIFFPPVEFAITSAIQSVFLLHVLLPVEETARAEIFALRSTGGVAAEFARIVFFLLDLLAIVLAFGFFGRPTGRKSTSW